MDVNGVFWVLSVCRAVILSLVLNFLSSFMPNPGMLGIGPRVLP